MEIKMNNSMKKLLSNYQFNNFSNVYNFTWWHTYDDIISNRVLKSASWDSEFWDSINETSLEWENREIGYSFKFMNNSIRVDEFYLKIGIEEEMALFYSFIMIGGWLSNLKKLYPDDKFIFLIQYDSWDDDVNSWFFVKSYHYRDFQRLFWVKDILKFDLPYISLSL